MVLELKALRLSASRTLLRSLLVREGRVSLEEIVNGETDGMLLEIEAHILALDVAEVHLSVTARVECPADWWQHLKQRFAPAWVLRRWPVETTVDKQTDHRQADFRVAIAGLNLRLPPGVTAYRMVTVSSPAEGRPKP